MRAPADIDDVLAFWQPRCGRCLTNCDAKEISANIAGFIRVLLDWENRERMELTVDTITGPDANAEDK